MDDFWFKSLEDAVREEWGVEPLRIREGGVSLFTLPITPDIHDYTSPFLLSRISRRSLPVRLFISR